METPFGAIPLCHAHAYCDAVRALPKNPPDQRRRGRVAGLGSQNSASNRRKNSASHCNYWKRLYCFTSAGRAITTSSRMTPSSTESKMDGVKLIIMNFISCAWICSQVRITFGFSAPPHSGQTGASPFWRNRSRNAWESRRMACSFPLSTSSCKASARAHRPVSGLRKSGMPEREWTSPNR